MVVVHGTKKFLDRVGRPTADPDTPSTGRLGSWYATILFWKPQVALLVNEPTFLPVVMPFAPAATFLDRVPATLHTVFRAHQLPRAFIDHELDDMGELRLAKTNSRRVLGVMNEFAFLADVRRSGGHRTDQYLALSIELAHTPCGPLYKTHIFPDQALHALTYEERP
jgi:uncharacterized protein DUF6933